VEHRPVLGDVDVLAREHRVAALGDARVRGELQQQRQRLVGDQVLRVVEVELTASAVRRFLGRRRRRTGPAGTST
jgi:hypothetical protein